MLEEQQYDSPSEGEDFEVGDVQQVSITKGQPICVEIHCSRSITPDTTPRTSESSESWSQLTNVTSIATNGPLSNAPRASPGPQASVPPIPNGKPTSPYNERSNPMSPSAQIAAQTVSSKDPKAAAQAASDMRNVVRRKLTGYVGFANLPNQWHRKSVRKGFNFNVMVVGGYHTVH